MNKKNNSKQKKTKLLTACIYVWLVLAIPILLFERSMFTLIIGFISLVLFSYVSKIKLDKLLLGLLPLFTLYLLIYRYTTYDGDNLIFKYTYVYLITCSIVAFIIFIATIVAKGKNLYNVIYFIAPSAIFYIVIILIFLGINSVFLSNSLSNETLIYLDLVLSLCLLSYSDIIISKFKFIDILNATNFKIYAYFLAIAIIILTNIAKFEFPNFEYINLISDITYQGIMTFIAIDTFIQIYINNNNKNKLA